MTFKRAYIISTVGAEINKYAKSSAEPAKTGVPLYRRLGSRWCGQEGDIFVRNRVKWLGNFELLTSQDWVLDARGEAFI